MTTPIGKDTLHEFIKLRMQAGRLEELISNRLDYIVRKVFGCFGKKVTYWYVEGAEEGDGGDLMKALRWSDDVISNLRIEWSGEASPNSFVIIDHDGNEFGFGEGEVPRRWLFEEFEKELTDGIIAYKRKVEKQKEKRKQARAAKKAEKEQLKASAASKLTPAERKALGL